MSAQENKAIIRRLVEAFNNQELDILDELFTEDYIDHEPFPDQVPGPVGVKHANGLFYQAFPDIIETIDDMIAEDDRVVVRWTCSGTHEGLFTIIPPTGKHVQVTGIEIYRLVDGKIAENWHNTDALGLLGQLGVLPPLLVGDQAGAPIDEPVAEAVA
jgi:steroid delta-isomerase-like uncharacterized protein